MMQREPFQDVNGQLAAARQPQQPVSTATAKAPGVPATPSQPAAQRKDSTSAGAAITPAPQSLASTAKQTQGAQADTAGAAVLSQPGNTQTLVAGAVAASSKAAESAPEAQAWGLLSAGPSHLAVAEVSQPADVVLVGSTDGAATPAVAPTSTAAAGATLLAATKSGAAATAEGHESLTGTGSSGLLQQSGRKRPAPSSTPDGCHMQKTPRPMAAAAGGPAGVAGAAGASAAVGGAGGGSNGPASALDSRLAAVRLSPPAAPAAAAAAAAVGPATEAAAAEAAAAALAAGAATPTAAGAAAAAADDQGVEVNSGKEQEGGQQTWQELLWSALSAAAPPTRFACSGCLDELPLREPLPFLCPEVSVEGVGRLGLPLSVEQASTLKAVAEQAPHGKGLRTVLDTTVRDAWEVNASRVSIGISWQPVLQQAVAQVAEQLGFVDSGTAAAAAAAGTSSSTAMNVEARLSKLLLYEQGGHFSAHQDTEKERDKIGTLVVQLPCAQGHTGGSLIVGNRGKSHIHEFEQGSDRTLQYAAFFADCQHELSSISSGMRLVLVYNLVWAGPAGEAPRLCKSNPEEQLARALNAWEAELAAGGTQQRMSVLLEHQYTEATLSFDHLKGNDLTMARSLSTCPGIDAHLVLVTPTVSGERGLSGGLKRRRCDNGSTGATCVPHTTIEVHPERVKTGLWVAVDGSKFDFGKIDAEKDMYEPDDRSLFVEDSEQEDEECEGDTGTAGSGVRRNRQRALLVMWPRSQSLSYAQSVGLPAVLSVLKRRIADAEAQLNTSNSSSSKGMLHQQPGSSCSAASNASRGVGKHVLAALKACVTQLEQLQAQPADQQPQPAGAVQTSSSATASANTGASTSQQVSTVLQQGVRAVQLGVIGARYALLRVMAVVANSQFDLTDTGLIQQLGEAAALLDAAAVGPLLQQLVIRCMPSCPAGCLSLVSCLEGVRQLQQQVVSAAVAAAGTTAAAVEQLLALAASVPDLSCIRGQIVGKVVAAMQQDRSAATKVAAFLVQPQQQEEPLQQQLLGAGCTALRSPTAQTPTYQASVICAMLPALAALPSLQQQVQAALADGIFGNAGLLAAQTDSSMLHLCAVLLSVEQLRDKHFAAFAAGVAQRLHSVHLLLQLVHKQLPEAALQQLVDAVSAAAAAMHTATAITATDCSSDGGSGSGSDDVSPPMRSTATLTATNNNSSGGGGGAGGAAPAAAGGGDSAAGSGSDGAAAGVAGGSAAAAAGGGVSLQVCDWARLINALRQTPALQQQLRCVVAQAVCTNRTLLAAQSDASMLALSHQLLQDDQLQAAHYEQFAAAAANRPSSEGLLGQLLESFAVQQSAAALDSLVAAAADNIRNRSDSWQVVAVQQVASALEDAPAAQQKVCTAITEAVINNEELLAAQTDDSMLQLSQVLLADPALQAAHYAQFAAAVLQRQDETFKVLQLLLQPGTAETPCGQLVAAAAAALRRRSTVWQVADTRQLLKVLEAWPVLQQQLQGAIADAMFTKPALLAAQTDPSVLKLSRLLLENESLQEAHYEQFAAAAAARPDSANVLGTLLKSAFVTASAAAQEQLAAAAAAAIRARSNTWQVYCEGPLLSALKGSPALQERVETAIAEAVFTQAALRTAQTDGSMVQLCLMLIGNPQLQAAYHTQFAAAVSRHRTSYELCEQLLQLRPVTEALANPAVQQVVCCQIANLRRLSAVPPFTWCMPEAVVPRGVVEREMVQAFLRGPNSYLAQRGFTGIVDARKAANALLGVYSRKDGRSLGYGYGRTDTYTVEAVADGHGRNAYVRITKTRGWYDRQVAQTERYRKELESVMALKRAIPEAGSNQ